MPPIARQAGRAGAAAGERVAAYPGEAPLGAGVRRVLAEGTREAVLTPAGCQLPRGRGHRLRGHEDGWTERVAAAHGAAPRRYLQRGAVDGGRVVVVALAARAAAAEGEAELEQGGEVLGAHGLQGDAERGRPAGLPRQGAVLCGGRRGTRGEGHVPVLPEGFPPKPGVCGVPVLPRLPAVPIPTRNVELWGDVGDEERARPLGSVLPRHPLRPEGREGRVANDDGREGV